jgi:hypothetical protein
VEFRQFVEPSLFPVRLVRWQVKRKRRIVAHGGCGARLITRYNLLDNDLLRESLPSRYRRREFPAPDA